MKLYEKEKVVEKDVQIGIKCDLCGDKTDDSNLFSDGGVSAGRAEIDFKTYLEGEPWDNEEFEFCPDCFETFILPKIKQAIAEYIKGE